jgi:hypothetical protein
MRGRGPSPFHGAPKSSRPEKGGTLSSHQGGATFRPSRCRQALRLAGRWGPRNPIRPALGSLRSSENWRQRGIREFFNSLLSEPIDT